ncbi:hypothetical protein ACFPRL_10015 [Pseudoclavibacter helvolus]
MLALTSTRFRPSRLRTRSWARCSKAMSCGRRPTPTPASISSSHRASTSSWKTRPTRQVPSRIARSSTCCSHKTGTA